VIRDQEDFNRHVDYIHYNPVKHGYVDRLEDWPRSSYRQWMARGYYELGWGHTEPERVANLSFE